MWVGVSEKFGWIMLLAVVLERVVLCRLADVQIDLQLLLPFALDGAP